MPGFLIYNSLNLSLIRRARPSLQYSSRPLRDNARPYSLVRHGWPDFILSRWVGGLKRAIALALACHARELWQPGFFDHVLRSDESYAEKWQYVLENPVRAGLVREMEEWHQGEIVLIDRV
ncbi:MAG: hypothetical protein DME32_13050 [Verrucomicrobia bacterium]|nr:MAG: hypothetical protein DME32_13050 [Verrucomicrobiota bacterium]